jgi:oligopeptide/dipeptide ABC transporter ATP-binding protein
VAHPAQRSRGRRDRERLAGDIPSALHPPSGCRFHTRCPFAQDRCSSDEPVEVTLSPTHWAACHRVHDPELAPLAASGR